MAFSRWAVDELRRAGPKGSFRLPDSLRPTCRPRLVCTSSCAPSKIRRTSARSVLPDASSSATHLFRRQVEREVGRPNRSRIYLGLPPRAAAALVASRSNSTSIVATERASPSGTGRTLHLATRGQRRAAGPVGDGAIGRSGRRRGAPRASSRSSNGITVITYSSPT